MSLSKRQRGLAIECSAKGRRNILEFEHFVITRFNVRVGDTAADTEWLQHRLTFFRDVCCPSLRSQTNRNFRWLVLFDSERQPWFEHEIRTLSRDAPFEPVWVPGRFDGSIVSSIIAVRSAADWVITTRVDNDDAVAVDYIDAIQSEFRGQPLEFLNFHRGLQLNEAGELYHRLDPSNAFISLIERRSGETLNTVYVTTHDQVKQFATLRQIDTHPMWLQMVHGRNLANAARGVRANPKILSEYFDVYRTPATIGRRALAMSQARTAASLMWRVLQQPSRVRWLAKVILIRLRVLKNFRRHS